MPWGEINIKKGEGALVLSFALISAIPMLLFIAMLMDGAQTPQQLQATVVSTQTVTLQFSSLVPHGGPTPLKHIKTAIEVTLDRPATIDGVTTSKFIVLAGTVPKPGSGTWVYQTYGTVPGGHLDTAVAGPVLYRFEQKQKDVLMKPPPEISAVFYFQYFSITSTAKSGEGALYLTAYLFGSCTLLFPRL